jgi:hypothetical protein
VLPTWNHLWFVAYLWLYTMALGSVLQVAPGLMQRAGQAIAPLLSGGSGAGAAGGTVGPLIGCCCCRTYIVHQTAIILIAHQLKELGLAAGIEAGIVIVGTVVSCAATYEIVRHARVLRPLCGPHLGNGNQTSVGSRQIRPLQAES